MNYLRNINRTRLKQSLFVKWCLFTRLVLELFSYVIINPIDPSPLTAQNFFLNDLFCLFIFLWFKKKFIDFDGYYIIITEEGQPRLKYIFNKCETNTSTFSTLQRFGPSPSPSPNFKWTYLICWLSALGAIGRLLGAILGK